MVSQAARDSAARFIASPNPTAYYNGLSAGRKRLVDAGLSAANLVRVAPYVRPPTPTQAAPRQRHRQAPTPTPTQAAPRPRHRQAPTPTPTPTPTRNARGQFIPRPPTPTPLTPTPRAPNGRRVFVGNAHRTTTSGTQININGRVGIPINFLGSIAHTYYLTITPQTPLRSDTEIRELLGRQRYPFMNPNKFYSARGSVEFESGATKGGGVASQMYMNWADLQQSILALVLNGFNHYGAITQIEIEIIET